MTPLGCPLNATILLAYSLDRNQQFSPNREAQGANTRNYLRTFFSLMGDLRRQPVSQPQRRWKVTIDFDRLWVIKD